MKFRNKRTFSLCWGQLERLKPRKNIYKTSLSWMKETLDFSLWQRKNCYIIKFSIYFCSKFFLLKIYFASLSRLSVNPDYPPPKLNRINDCSLCFTFRCFLFEFTVWFRVLLSCADIQGCLLGLLDDKCDCIKTLQYFHKLTFKQQHKAYSFHLHTTMSQAVTSIDINVILRNNKPTSWALLILKKVPCPI
jgi:hypothetical protein